MISEILTESIELSKNLIVNNKKKVIIIPRIITAYAGANESITPENTRPKRNPIPDITLFRARIVPYSLGLACESI